MLTEWMLAKILKIPWSEVHEEADKIEHTISDDVEKSLNITLKAPDSCPHGNPMPGSDIEAELWFPLSRCRENDQIIIRRIHEFLEDDHKSLQFLESQDIMPGHSFSIQKITDSKITLRLLSIGKLVSLVCAHVLNDKPTKHDMTTERIAYLRNITCFNLGEQLGLIGF